MGNRKIHTCNGRLKLAISFCVALSASIATSCGVDKCDTPFGDGCTIDINRYSDLSNVGGATVISHDDSYFPVGYHGIIVHRTTYSSFVAFECTCTKDHEVRLQSAEGWDNAIMVCPACGSMFETEYGNPIDGSAAVCPLYEYNTSFDGRMLSIY